MTKRTKRFKVEELPEFDATQYLDSEEAIAAYLTTLNQRQQDRPDTCTGGQGTEPYEQYTQQSPDFGRSTAPHCSHS